MDQEAKLLLIELNSLKVLKVLEAPDLERSPKSSESSEASRKKGNELYRKKHHTILEHLEILKLYSKSVAFAPAESEDLAKAYANRSALLLHLKKYDECVRDIERSLEITRAKDLREKLRKRREECVRVLNIISELEKRRAERRTETNQLVDLDTFSKLTLRDYDKNKLLERDTNDSVQIRYNDKYGRFLVANRDIKPGEIIFAEKPYVNAFNTKHLYTHCGHCLTMTWSGIPCEHCGWFIYCSEKCKSEAWVQYHDIECFCIFYILYFTNYAKEKTGENVCFDGLCIRAMIKGLREAGSLEKLKEQLKSVDTCSDRRTKGFSENGTFESSKFISLYSLSNSISGCEMKGHAIFAAIALTCIARYTKFFGDAFDSFSITELLKNQDAIFIGSLILRLIKISNVNSHCVLNITDQCKYSYDTATCKQNWCCVRGTCIVPIASLTNNSCNPNARRCFTNDQTFILYAIQPIKINSQIYDSYYCSYYEGENPMRKNVLKQNFNFMCDCIACKKNWPCHYVFKVSAKEFSLNVKLHHKEMSLWKEYKNLIESIENKTIEFDQSLLHSISKAIEKSMSLMQPSDVTCKIIYTLIEVFEILYGYNTQFCNKC